MRATDRFLNDLSAHRQGKTFSMTLFEAQQVGVASVRPHAWTPDRDMLRDLVERPYMLRLSWSLDREYSDESGVVQ